MSLTVAIIDSGVNPTHPHVGNIAGGIEIRPTGTSEQYLDYLGHGTAVAGAIHEKAPQARLYIVKVFHQTLNTTIDQLLRALDHALSIDAALINLSLGTANPAHRERFLPYVERARERGARVVSAAGTLPGSLPGVIGVECDSAIPRGEMRLCLTADGPRCYASGEPRPIPGVPQGRNLSGISFAVANVTGLLASL